jgi:hypothetical protein
MLTRRRFKQSVSFHDRLATFANDARKQASRLPPGPEREDLLRKARQADAASQMDEWTAAPRLAHAEIDR